eukprot:2636421-Rhodomonas_salina.1
MLLRVPPPDSGDRGQVQGGDHFFREHRGPGVHGRVILGAQHESFACACRRFRVVAARDRPTAVTTCHCGRAERATLRMDIGLRVGMGMMLRVGMDIVLRFGIIIMLRVEMGIILRVEMGIMIRVGA